MNETMTVFKLQMNGGHKYFTCGEDLVEYVQKRIQQSSMQEIEIDMCLGSMADQLAMYEEYEVYE